MTSTKSRATGEGLRCGGKTAANSKSIRGRKWRATTPRLANSCAVNGSQIATPSPDDTNPHMISDRLVSTRRTRRTSSRLKAWSIRWRPVDPAVSDTSLEELHLEQSLKVAQQPTYGRLCHSHQLCRLRHAACQHHRAEGF